MKIPKYLLNRKEPKIPFTREGYDKIVTEKAALESGRPDAVEHLRKAREMGDLSENGYYRAARQRLSSIDSRLRHLTRLIRNAKIVQSANTGIADIGSTVSVSINGSESTYTIVGGYESDPTLHTVSHRSPLGQALMGKKKGDSVTVRAPAGEMTYTVVAVS